MVKSGLGKISFVLIILFVANCSSVLARQEYSALKKFLSARMYPEAYDELMRSELRNKMVDPKLVKLKRSMLKNTRRDVIARLRTNSQVHMMRTILADLEYQDNQLDRGIENISLGLENESSPLANYVLAKLLFAKGDLQQSYEAMEKAFHGDPGSEVLMADFEFLYKCKNYGVTTAKKLSQDSEFLKRVVQVSGKKTEAPVPISPFENDPTKPPKIGKPPEPEPTPEPVKPPIDEVIVKDPDDLPDDVNTGSPSVLVTDAPDTPDTPDPFDTPDIPDKPPVQPDVPVVEDPPPVEPEPEPPVSLPVTDVDDPEQKKMVLAEKLLKEAEAKVEEREFEEARILLKKARKAFPELPGLDEVENKIKATVESSMGIEEEYLKAMELFKNQKYDLALPGIQKAFDDNPNKHPEAAFNLGRAYQLGEKKDYKKARKYFEICFNHPDTPVELKREIEWTIIGLLADDKNYKEAYLKFSDFEKRERDFAKSSSSYWKLKYLLTLRYYQNEFLTGIGLFIVFALLILLMRVFPAIGSIFGDPVKKAEKAFASGKYERAAKIAEDALNRGQEKDVQKKLLEICVESHYYLKNFFKCQDHAKHLLNIQPENHVAFQFITKSFLDSKSTTDEAIAMYEEAYRRDPENKGFLPFLAKHYINNREFSMEALGVMFDYFQNAPDNRENVIGLAEAYVQTKRMSEEVIPVMQEALNDQPTRMEFRELLARNYAKLGEFSEATRECLLVLNKDVNNMGIHVVYTSCMKKMNMLEEALLQYEEFAKKFPGNAQINEILTGLRRELEQATEGAGQSEVEEMAPFSEDIEMTAGTGFVGQELSDEEIESFVEPPLEGFDASEGEVPVPDFLKGGAENSQEAPEPEVSKPGVPKPGIPKRDLPEPLPVSSQKLAGIAEGAKRPTAGDEGCEVRAQNLAPLLHPEGGRDATGRVPPFIEKLPLPDPQDVGSDTEFLEDLVSGQKSSLEDFLDSEESKSDSSFLAEALAGEISDIPEDVGEMDDTELEKLISGSDDIVQELWGDEASPFVQGEGPGPELLSGSKSALEGFIDSPEDSTSGVPDKKIQGGIENVPDDFAPSGKEDFDPLSGSDDDLMSDISDILDEETGSQPAVSVRAVSKPPAKVEPSANVEDISEKVKQAKVFAGKKNWNGVIDTLSPVFATNRDKTAGVLLAYAYLAGRQPSLSREILETLEIDQEMMGDNLKEVIYRVGVSLEDTGDVPGALKMYDLICNVDINYSDAFDRSDRLYRQLKKA